MLECPAGGYICSDAPDFLRVREENGKAIIAQVGRRILRSLGDLGEESPDGQLSWRLEQVRNLTDRARGIAPMMRSLLYWLRMVRRVPNADDRASLMTNMRRQFGKFDVFSREDVDAARVATQALTSVLVWIKNREVNIVLGGLVQELKPTWKMRDGFDGVLEKVDDIGHSCLVKSEVESRYCALFWAKVLGFVGDLDLTLPLAEAGPRDRETLSKAIATSIGIFEQFKGLALFCEQLRETDCRVSGVDAGRP
jgi:hypothetical protein